MLKSIVKFGALGLLAAAVAGLPFHALAQSTNKTAAAKKPAAKEPAKAEKKQPNLPYKGNLTAIDKQAKTMTIGKRTFQITSDTKLFRAGKPATLDDGVKDEYVTLSYQKADGDKFNAHNVYFGGKEAAKAAEKKQGKNVN